MATDRDVPGISAKDRRVKGNLFRNVALVGATTGAAFFFSACEDSHAQSSEQDPRTPISTTKPPETQTPTDEPKVNPESGLASINKDNFLSFLGDGFELVQERKIAGRTYLYEV